MSSIRDFLGDVDRDERAACSIEAIIEDSSFTVVVRDHNGRIVKAGLDHLQVVGQKPDDFGERGQGLRYFDEHGRELPLLKSPAAIARTTGQPQRKRLFSVCYPNGREVWLKGDHLPLEAGSRGWAVLSLSVDVTDLYTERRDAERRVRQLEALLAVSQSGRERGESIEARAKRWSVLAQPLGGARLQLAIREGDRLMLHHINASPDASRPTGARMRAEMVARPNAGTHVNVDVQDRDLYGSGVLGELETPFRSVVTVALDGLDEWLIATAIDRDAFDALDVQFIEEAARMIAPSLLAGRQAA